MTICVIICSLHRSLLFNVYCIFSGYVGGGRHNKIIMEFVENVPENVSGVEMVEFLFLNENHNKHGDMHFFIHEF